MDYSTRILLVLAIGILLGAIYYKSVSSFPPRTYCYAGITTLSSSHKNANCFTVSSTGIISSVFSSTELQDVDPGFVIPGLWDGHGHLLQYGEFLSGVDLFGSSSLQEAQSRVREYAKKNPNIGSSQEWIRGVGWDQAAFEGRMPTAANLEFEKDLAGKYVMLDRVDVHCIWVSKAVLDLLPNPLPKSPPGGEIITDPGPGVFCDNAIDLVSQFVPRPGKDKKTEFVRRAMQELNKVGLVGMHDAGMVPNDLKLYAELADGKDWSLRVYAMLECDKRNTFCPQTALKIDRPDGLLRVQSVKLFADGALGSWGSALIEPYTDHPWTSGSLLVNASTLSSITSSWASIGYQVNIHAIGDQANRNAISAQISALSLVCPGQELSECQASRRFRIEHAQIVHPTDQRRMHDVGIIPSIQPTHATSDMAYAESRLGHLRTSTEAYRMRSFLPLKPVLGSDFPVEPPNPFQGIYAAIARRNPHTGLDRDGGRGSWYEEETLSLNEALEGFTKGPAHGAFWESKAGVIEEGAWADWVVLDRPLEAIDIEDLRTLKVRETWVMGKRVYKREG